LLLIQLINCRFYPSLFMSQGLVVLVGMREEREGYLIYKILASLVAVVGAGAAAAAAKDHEGCVLLLAEKNCV
jgi:hypothetical protein